MIQSIQHSTTIPIQKPNPMPHSPSQSDPLHPKLFTRRTTQPHDIPFHAHKHCKQGAPSSHAPSLHPEVSSWSSLILRLSYFSLLFLSFIIIISISFSFFEAHFRARDSTSLIGGDSRLWGWWGVGVGGVCRPH